MSENYHLAKQTNKNNATSISQGKRQVHAIGRKSIAALALFIFIMLFGTNIRAAELTIHAGTTTNNYVPIYGFYADAYLKCEFVYPEGDLTAMNGGTITGMKFYASTTDVDWEDARFQVFLKQYASTTLDAFQGPGTVVYTGSLSIVGGIMSVTFNTPYTYDGGNLLVGIYCTTTGSYVTSSWYGETANGASVQGYSYSNLSSITPSQRNFLPKVTFIYDVNDNGVCEGFDGTTLPTDWTTSGPGNWQTGVGDYSTATGTHTGARNALIKHSAIGSETYLISPSMDFSSAISVTLSFWYVNRKWGSDIDGLTVYYRISNGTWIQLFSTTTEHSTWTEQTIDLPAAALAADCQIGFKYIDDYGYGVGIDDVCFDITYITQCEDFESYSGANSSYNTSGSLPTGWTYIFSGTNTSEIPHLYNGEYARDGQGIIITTGGDAHGATNYVIMPAVSSIAPGNMTFNAWWESTSYGILTVGYITNPSDASTFVAIGTATPPTAYGSGSTTVGLYSFTIPSGVPAGARIAFELDHGTSTAWWSVCIDNICLPGASCEQRTASISGCSAASLYIGNTRQLTGSVSDGVGNVNWNSSDPSVATVSSSGLVTAVSPGTTTITYAREGDGTFCPVTANCSVTVSCSDGSWTIDEINGQTKNIECGRSYCFYDQGGPDVSYSNSTNYTCTFTSSGTISIRFLDFEVEGNGYDEFVVTGSTADGTYDDYNTLTGQTLVSASGSIEINFFSDGSVVKRGWKAVITAENCCSTPRTINITNCPSEELLWGTTHQLGYTLSAGGGAVVWRSSDENVATVSSTGLITAVAPGTAIITAIISNTGTFCSAEATCEVTVNCGGNMYSIGSQGGTSYEYGPVNNNWHYSIRQIIYDESELCVGAISGVAFHYATNIASPTRDNVKIYMGVRESTTFGSATDYTDVSAMEEVYSGSFDFTETGWKWFTFTTPYNYSGEGSLVMMIVDNSYADWNTSCTFYYTSCTGIKMLTAQRDGTTPYDENDLMSISFGTNSVRPDTRFCVKCCTEQTGVAGFTFCRDNLNIEIGGTVVMPVDGADGVMPGGDVTYTSSNPSVATVDADGTVHGIAVGSATITASIPAVTVSGVDYCAASASYMVNIGVSCERIGTEATTTNVAPVETTYKHSWTQMIYDKDEISTCCSSIDKISFFHNGTNTYDRDVKVYMGQPDGVTSFASNTSYILANQLTLVWESSVSDVEGDTDGDGKWDLHDGENVFTLPTPFEYDCNKNLVVAVYSRASGWSTSYFQSSTTTDNKTLYAYGDGDDNSTNDPWSYINTSGLSGFGANKGIGTNRPDIKLCFVCPPDVMPSMILTGVPAEPICAGNAISIDVAASNGTVDASALEAALPSGLTYSTSTNKITGSLSTTGTYEFDVTVKSADGCLKDTQHVTITIRQIDATISFPEP